MSLLGWIGIVAPAALGGTMLLQGDRSTAAWLLAAAAVVHLLSFWVIKAFDSSWTSLAYSVVVTNVGLALLGATSYQTDQSQSQQATAG